MCLFSLISLQHTKTIFDITMALSCSYSHHDRTTSIELGMTLTIPSCDDTGLALSNAQSSVSTRGVERFLRILEGG